MNKRLSRRRFAQIGTAAWSVVGSGCGNDQREGTGPSPLDGMGGVPRTCGELTAENTQGPFFLAGSPEATDIRGNLPGPPLLVRGKVYDTNCQPIVGALVDFWQADETGAYDQEGPTFRGHQFTSEFGAYSLSTIVPGRYLNGDQYRPAHLHVKITVPGFILTTQLYLPGDPFNDTDPFFVPELLVDVAVNSAEETHASFDFFLPLSP